MKNKFSKLLEPYQKMSLPVKVSFWFFACSLLQKGLSFLTTPIFTRVLSVDDYGMVSVYLSWEQIIIIFATFGLANSIFNVGLVKFGEYKDSFQSSMYGLATLCSIIFSAAFFGLYKFIKPVVQLEFKFALIMPVYCLFQTIMSMWSLRERFDYHYKKMVAITFASTFLGVLFSLAFVFCLNDKAFGKILGGAIVTILLGLFCFGDVYRKNGKLFNGQYWHFAFKYNLPMIPHFLSGVILSQLDRIMIKNMCGFREAGIYSVSYGGGYIVHILNTSLWVAYNPWILQRLQAKNYRGIKEIVNTILLAYVGLLVLMILFAPELLKILAPADYYEGIYVVPPVACSMFFTLLFNIFAPVEHFSLKTKFMGYASMIAAGANIFLNYIFITEYGYLAAGYTTLVCYILYALAHYIYMKRICKSQGINLFDDRFILLLAMVVVAIAITFAFIYRFPVVRYVLICFIFGLIILFRKRIVNVFKAIKR